jgi:hypothetical protein
MTGTGLKKWMPTKRSGRATKPASVLTERLEVLVAMIASGRSSRGGALEQVALDLEHLGRRLDEQVGVGAGRQVEPGRDAAEGGVALVGLHAALVDGPRRAAFRCRPCPWR